MTSKEIDPVVQSEWPTVDGEKVTVTDILTNMMLRQTGHIQDYDKIARAKGLPSLDPSLWGNLSHPAVQAKLREFAGYIVEELYEGINLLKNKPWKQTFRETDPEEFYGELGDFWHFVMEFHIYAGMMPDKIARYYFGMAEKNDTRKETGY